MTRCYVRTSEEFNLPMQEKQANSLALATFVIGSAMGGALNATLMGNIQYEAGINEIYHCARSYQSQALSMDQLERCRVIARKLRDPDR